MGSRAPDPVELVILTAAVFRLWKLAAEDKIADRPRDWLTARAPEWFSEQLECPWCSGFWISLAAVAAHRQAPRATLTAALPFAVSAGVGALGHVLSE